MDQAKLDKLVANREKAMAGGGEAAVEKHHAKGSYTCRERINMLLDEGSFEEVNMFLTHRCHDFGMEKKVFLGDGVAVGSGTIDGRLVFVFAQDATVIGGSLSETMALKICNVMDQAMKLGAPIIGRSQVTQRFLNVTSSLPALCRRSLLSSARARVERYIALR